MRIYDPTACIVYVHLSPRSRPSSAPPRMDDDRLDRLPAGYANQSPRTRVRRDTGPPETGAPEPVAPVLLDPAG